MAKVLFAVSDHLYVRNYLQTGALSKIQLEHELKLVAREHLSETPELTENNRLIGFYSIDRKMEKKHQLLFDLFMWKNRRKSKTFRYRWMRNSGWDMVASSSGLARKMRALYSWLREGTRHPVGLLVPLLGSSALFWLSSRALLRSLSTNQELQSLVESEKFDLIIFPSSAADSTSVELTRIGQKQNIPTLCLIDNWDNLSSKTVFWEKPNHLVVWGKQTQQQALQIHGFDASQVHPIGTPRFDAYFAAREVHEGSTPKTRYILFVGAAMPFDEIAALHSLERALEEQRGPLADVPVVYRPHPWQQKRLVPSTFHPDSFTRTVLDPQIAQAQASGVELTARNSRFQPNLDYYPGLLRGSCLIVGPLTTMLLEGALSLKPVVGLAYPDGVHPNTTRRYFSHFDGIERIPGFTICAESTELGRLLSEAPVGHDIDEKASDLQSDFFVHRGKGPYSDRLSAVANSIVIAG